MKKFLFSLFGLLLLTLPMLTMAATDNIDQLEAVGISGTSGLINNTGAGVKLSSESPITMAVNIINLSISFLGLGAVVIILIGGFQWMTAMGNDDSIKKAKKLMTGGVVGLIIVLAAWGIARYVVLTLSNTIAIPAPTSN